MQAIALRGVSSYREAIVAIAGCCCKLLPVLHCNLLGPLRLCPLLHCKPLQLLQAYTLQGIASQYDFCELSQATTSYRNASYCKLLRLLLAIALQAIPSLRSHYNSLHCELSQTISDIAGYRKLLNTIA